MPERPWVYLLIVLAIAARAATVLVLQSHRVPRSTYEHGEIAEHLLTGRGFSVKFLGADGPTSQQAPIYPTFVAAAYAVGGIDRPRARLILELGQAVLGGFLVLAMISLAREVAPGRPWVAFTAGLISAAHPTLVYAATHVQVALLAATLLTLTLALAYRAGRTRSFQDAFATGISFAVLVLTDPILVLVAPAVAWAIARRQPEPRGWRPIAIVAVTALLGIAPWMVRNAYVHGELVWIKSTFGYAFWQGNCAFSEGTDKVVRPSVGRVLKERSQSGDLKSLNEALWAARHEAGYLDDIALTAADYREFGTLTEPERSRRLFHRALADLRAEPWRYPRLCLRRLQYFVFFDETNPKTRSRLYRASHLGLTLLAVLGLWLAPRSLRRSLAPTILTAGLITLFHVLTIVSARFHIPLEPLLGLWAACGLGGVPHQPRRPTTS